MATENQSTAADMKWQEPPGFNRGTKSPKWAAVAEQLRSRPGEWALVAEGASASIATNIKRGFCKGMPRGQFEATGRVDANKRYDIYARYVGGEPL